MNGQYEAMAAIVALFTFVPIGFLFLLNWLVKRSRRLHADQHQHSC